MPKHRWYRVVRNWSNEEAAYVYAIFQYSDWGDAITKACVGTGDEAWAQRNAEHHGVPIDEQTDHTCEAAFDCPMCELERSHGL